jgi:hypothetical protein
MNQVFFPETDLDSYAQQNTLRIMCRTRLPFDCPKSSTQKLADCCFCIYLSRNVGGMLLRLLFGYEYLFVSGLKDSMIRKAPFDRSFGIHYVAFRQSTSML